MAKDYAKNRGKKSKSRSYEKNSIPGWFWLLTGLVIGFLGGGLMYLKNFHSQAIAVNQVAPEPAENLAHHHKSENKQANLQNPHQPHFDFYTMLPKMQVGNAQTINQTDTTNSNQDVDPLQQQHPVPQNTMAQNNSPTPAPANPQQNLNLQNIDPAQKALNRFETNKEKDTNQNTQKKPDNNSQTSPTTTSPLPTSAPTSTPKQNNTPSSSTNPPDSDHKPKAYLVIVKGLQAADKSDQLKAQLLLSGYDVKFEPVNLAGQKFNRIILGPFKSKDEAEQAKAALSGQQLNSEIRGLKVEQ